MPRVVASAPKVVVTEWMTATPLSAIITDGTTEQRNTAGALLAEFHFVSPAQVGLLHCDPHPGNFMLHDDGRLGIIDFGATAPMPNGLPPVLGRMVRLNLEERFDELTELLRANGFVLPVALSPIRRSPTTFARSPIRSAPSRSTSRVRAAEGGRDGDRSVGQPLPNRACPQPPAEYLMIFRVLLGSVGICAQLDACAPYMAILTKWLPASRTTPTVSRASTARRVAGFPNIDTRPNVTRVQLG